MYDKDKNVLHKSVIIFFYKYLTLVDVDRLLFANNWDKIKLKLMILENNE